MTGLGCELTSLSSAETPSCGYVDPKSLKFEEESLLQSYVAVTSLSFVDTQWVCAASSAVPTGRIFWPLAGKSLPAALHWCDQPPLLL